MKCGLFSIEISGQRKGLKRIASSLNDALENKIKKFNRRGPSMIRGAFADALSENSTLAKFAQAAQSMPAESRIKGHPKLGQGLKLRFEKGAISMRLLFNPHNFGDETGFWIVYTAQYGRKALRKRTKDEGPYAIAMLENQVSPEYRRKHRFLHPHFDKPGYVAVFAMSAGPVEPWYDWKSRMTRKLEKRIKEYASTL